MTFYFVNCLFEVLCILYVKNKIFLSEERILRHNKRTELLSVLPGSLIKII